MIFGCNCEIKPKDSCYKNEGLRAICVPNFDHGSRPAPDRATRASTACVRTSWPSTSVCTRTRLAGRRLISAHSASNTLEVFYFRSSCVRSCRLDFSDDRCQTNLNDCAVEPCKNNGTCVDGVASYETLIDMLTRQSVPQPRRVSHASRRRRRRRRLLLLIVLARVGLEQELLQQRHVLTYHLICLANFKGDLCEISTDPCSTNPLLFLYDGDGGRRRCCSCCCCYLGWWLRLWLLQRGHRTTSARIVLLLLLYLSISSSSSSSSSSWSKCCSCCSPKKRES